MYQLGVHRSVWAICLDVIQLLLSVSEDSKLANGIISHN